MLVDAEGFRIRADEGGVFAVRFDREDSSLRRQSRGFDGNRTRTGANVPDDVLGPKIQFSESQDSHLGRRQQSPFRSALAESVVGIPEESKDAAATLRIGDAGLANEHHHAERTEFHLGDFARRSLRDDFIAGAEVFADVDAEAVEPGGRHRPGDELRRPGFGGEESGPFGNADAVENLLDAVARGVAEEGFVPILFDARERQLHAADVRSDLDAFLAEAINEKLRNAIEERIAADQDDDLSLPRFFVDATDDGVEVGSEREFFGGSAGGFERSRRSGEQRRFADDAASRFGEPGKSVVSHADDVDRQRFVFGRHWLSPRDPSPADHSKAVSVSIAAVSDSSAPLRVGLSTCAAVGFCGASRSPRSAYRPSSHTKRQ